MQTDAELVIIGAGIVGCSAAAALARRGWRDVVVLEQGPLFATGGSSSHAPGLVFQTNSSQTICQLAQASVAVYRDLDLDGQPCFASVGSLEIATTPERWADLHRRQEYAQSWGLVGALLTPAQAAAQLPLLDPAAILGAYFVATDGTCRAVRAAEALARQAIAAGVCFHGGVEVTDIVRARGAVCAVETSHGRIATRRVLLCAGIWGPRIGRMAGLPVALTPVQHQYVKTLPLAALAGEVREIGHPILRHQDARLYFRQHGACYGIGSYAHEPILTRAADIRRHDASAVMPSVMPFTPEHFAEPWLAARALLPALESIDASTAINGLFSFTPDGLPLVGESAQLSGFWVAEAVWVTQGAGVGEQVAEWMTSGSPTIDMRECNVNRFDAYAYTEAYIATRGAQQYREVYDIIHPLQQVAQLRPLRTSPFYCRQQSLGAHCFEARGWERPYWYETNRALLDGSEPTRSGWAAQGWSPIIHAEHRVARERVAMFDMTTLARCEIVGTDALALLQSLATNQIDRPLGSLIYTMLCDDRGGVLSDITVTRLADDRFWVAHNGPNDLAYLQIAARGAQVQVRDVTGGTCCIGLWGPQAAALLQSRCDDDLAQTNFPYLTGRKIAVGAIPVLALRVSYVGEAGWELYSSAEYGLALWDLLWEAGQQYGVIAAGRGAFESMRVEKGYRFYGNDIHTGYDPYAAGLGFAVKPKDRAFRGRDALVQIKAAGTTQQLCCLMLDDPTLVLLGKEPVFSSSQCVGYVTSATYGASVGRSIAYAYLPLALAAQGTPVEIAYFGVQYRATVVAEPVFDPAGARMRG